MSKQLHDSAVIEKGFVTIPMRWVWIVSGVFFVISMGMLTYSSPTCADGLPPLRDYRCYVSKHEPQGLERRGIIQDGRGGERFMLCKRSIKETNPCGELQ